MTDASGNHDITLDPNFYKEHGLYFHNQSPQDSQACIDLIKEHPSITYLNHESTNIYLMNEDGPRTRFKVFGSPYSPANGLWAFGYSPEDASLLWDQIHLDTDVVITHTPPKHHCDQSRHQEASGCENLRQTLWRVRPSLAVCGHVHEGRGAERILWDLDCPNEESATGYWTDPGLGLGNRKQSHLDLSAKSPAPLNNIRSWIDASDGMNLDGREKTAGDCLSVPKSAHSLAWTSAISRSGTSISGASSKEIASSVLGKIAPVAQNQDHAPNPRVSETVTSEYGTSNFEASFKAAQSKGFREAPQVFEDHGGSPPSGRCDMEDLAGRETRKETCIINAAIMASSWPYKLKDSRKYNKPIIVDIDLPLWQNSE